METIRNYLEMMFADLTNTAEVKRAKEELWQMMEDKFDEEIVNGKSENEAVASVIANFGNLDELAETLGLKKSMIREERPARRRLSFDEIQDYLSAKVIDGALSGLAVGMFICCASGVIAETELFGDEHYLLGLILLFAMIAGGVGILIYNAAMMKKWDYIKKEPCSIDFQTANYVSERKEAYNSTNAIMNAIGVGLCVISVVPVIAISEFTHGNDKFEAIGVVALLLLVAAGVFFFIFTGSINTGYDTILSVNDPSTVAGDYRKRK